MNWLSYYNQAYEVHLAIYSIRAKMQKCSEMTKVLLSESLKVLEEARDNLIKTGDEARAASKNGSSSYQAGPATEILRERDNSPA